MRAAEEAEEFVEAALLRMQLGTIAKVPLTDHAGGVAKRLHAGGQGGFRQWQTELCFGGLLRPRIELVAEALLVTSRVQPGASRAANRTGNVPAGEPDAVPRDGIDIGSRDIFVALHAELGVPEVVGDNKQDIGFARGGAAPKDR